MLTQKKLDSLAPMDQEYTISDRDGLSLRVRPSGIKTWIFRYRYLNRQQRITIGRYDRQHPEKGFSMPQARSEARRLGGLLERGQNPKNVIEQEKSALLREEEQKQKTLRHLVTLFDEKVISKRMRPDPPRQLLTRDVLPYLGDKQADEITRKELLSVLDRVVNRAHSRNRKKGAPTSANRLLSLLKQLFKFASQRDWVKSNPLSDITKEAVGGREKSRDRELDESELKVLLDALRIWKTAEQNILFIRFLLGSGQRIATCNGALWEEFDLNEAVWRIPPSDEERATKTISNNARKLPLSTYLLDILNEQLTSSAISRFVWPPTQGKDLDRPFNQQSINALIERNNYAGLAHFTPHDLRRSMTTRMAELCIPPHIPEKICGHQMAGMMAIYNRFSYFKEQGQALESWGGYLRYLEEHAATSGFSRLSAHSSNSAIDHET
ncbi:MAG: tyrosine-type recombinase/integrase [Endozoicomonas sp.]